MFFFALRPSHLHLTLAPVFLLGAVLTYKAAGAALQQQYRQLEATLNDDALIALQGVNLQMRGGEPLGLAFFIREKRPPSAHAPFSNSLHFAYI